jgi:hypothetical protein
MKIDRSLIGQIITVKIPERDHTGKVIPAKSTKITGTCTYAGYNKYLGTKQVTIGRTPIFPVSELDISLPK